MLNVLVNAYAVSPSWGSEPGMGWNWVINLALYCNVFVVTEGEWCKEIEAAVAKLPQRERLHFYYNPMPEYVRKICWNQGDWRFYWYYRKWQKQALNITKQIILENHIDIIHQLNMIGFREPGFLWKIPNIPFIWGPVGGMELMPVAYLRGESITQICKVYLKNIINNMQRKYQPRLLKILDRATCVIAATKGVFDVMADYHGKRVLLINETGCYVSPINAEAKGISEGLFNILWVGKFDFRKQLGLALRVIAALPKTLNVKFHVVGSGSESEKLKYRQLSINLGISDKVVWHGSMPHEMVLRFMQSCDLFLFTSIMEGTPHVVLESLQSNLPIVCFDICGQAGVVNDKVGVKIPISNIKQSVVDFSSAIERLIRDRKTLNSLKCNCRERQNELAWEKKAAQMVDIYKKIKLDCKIKQEIVR